LKERGDNRGEVDKQPLPFGKGNRIKGIGLREAKPLFEGA